MCMLKAQRSNERTIRSKAAYLFAVLFSFIIYMEMGSSGPFCGTCAAHDTNTHTLTYSEGETHAKYFRMNVFILMNVEFGAHKSIASVTLLLQNVNRMRMRTMEM